MEVAVPSNVKTELFVESGGGARDLPTDQLAEEDSRLKIEIDPEQIQYKQQQTAENFKNKDTERSSYGRLTVKSEFSLDELEQTGSECAELDSEELGNELQPSCTENTNGHVASKSIHLHRRDLEEHKMKKIAHELHCCPQCSKPFRQAKALERHIKRHKNGKYSECKYCKRTFETNGILKRHMRAYHERTSFDCPQCSMKFDLEIDLVEHSNVHKLFQNTCQRQRARQFNPSPATESASDQQITEGQELERILKTSAPSLKSAESNSILKSYLEAVPKNLPIPHKSAEHAYYNGTDGSDQMNAADVNEYQHRATFKGPFKCDICSRKFVLLKKFLRHQEKHALGIPDYVCQICSKDFQKEETLQKHIIRYHGAEKALKAYPCNLCPKKFQFQKNLLKHKLVHSSKRHQCKCGKLFKEKNALDAHYKYHHLQRPQENSADSLLQTILSGLSGQYDSGDCFKCIQCGKSFVDTDAFRSHVDTCESLLKPVSYVNSMQAPKVRHFACNQCGKIFDSREIFERHRATHENVYVEDEYDKSKQADGSYKCTLCLRIFKWKNSFKRHVLENHPSPVTFSCMKCKVAVTSILELSQHLRTHGEEGKTAEKRSGVEKDLEPVGMQSTSQDST